MKTLEISVAASKNTYQTGCNFAEKESAWGHCQYNSSTAETAIEHLCSVGGVHGLLPSAPRCPRSHPASAAQGAEPTAQQSCTPGAWTGGNSAGLSEQAYRSLIKVKEHLWRKPLQTKTVEKPYCSRNNVETKQCYSSDSLVPCSAWGRSSLTSFLTWFALINLPSQTSWLVHCPMKAQPFTP